MKDKANGIIDKHVPLTWVIVTAAALIIWGIRLEGRVAANEIINTNTRLQIDEIDRRTTRIEKNQVLIMHELGIEPFE